MASRIRQEAPGRGEAKAARQAIVILLIVLCSSISGIAADRGMEATDGDGLRSLSLNGFFDPERNFLDATVKLNFAAPAGERRLWLAQELALTSVRGGTQPAMDFKRDCGQFLVLAPGEKDLELDYCGRLGSDLDPFAAAGGQGRGPTPAEVDDYRFLSYIKDFYPNPRIDFTPMKMKFSVPSGWNCLGSGRFCSMRSDQGLNFFEFDNDSAKGMALVCGRFIQLGFLDGAVKLRVHGGPGFDYEHYFTNEDLAGVASFLRERFGALHLPELNVLFRRGRSFGGVSYNGLIVLNVDNSWASLGAKTRKAVWTESPLSVIDVKLDILAHELAHQWWGGLVSWKSPMDNWVTEGLATYSTLLLLRDRQGEGPYREAISRLRRWVKKYAKLGASADGFKLKLANRDIRVYQTLVYVKPALMLAELADRIGESELCSRLRGILEDRRFCNVDTEEFLRRLGAGDAALQARLAEWIRGRGLPPCR